MNKWNNRYNGLLFHGSPKKLDQLEKGNWVTFNKEVARALSHEPTRMFTDTCFRTIKHNGVVPGFLYVIDEEVDDHELIEHPDKARWQTPRTLKIKLVEEVPIIESELLTTK